MVGDNFPKLGLIVPTLRTRRYTQVCFGVVIPAWMPDPLEREANPAPWTVTRILTRA